MCGIIGVAVQNPNPNSNNRAVEVCLNGLKRLEYRGYDSAGIAIVDESSSLQIRKKSGRLENLIEEIENNPFNEASIAIGHTRWATHGKATDSNAHPHFSYDKKVAVIHNGIIENSELIRESLIKDGVKFSSTTDTEVAAHLLAKTLETNSNLADSMREIVKLFKGTFTFLAIEVSNPQLIVAAKHDSPLVIGLGENENFLASDVSAFIDWTKRAVIVEQDQIVELTSNSVRITDSAGFEKELKEYEVNWNIEAANKGGHSTFMEKEIREEPVAIANTLLNRIDETTNELKLDEFNVPKTEFENSLSEINRVIIIGCGTASYAGMVGKYIIEQFAKLPVVVELSHEFRYRDVVVDNKTLVISISQSGETMDTLMAIKKAKELNAKTLSICNTQGSSISSVSDAVFQTYAGPEISVASTKAFVAQLTACYLVGLYLASRNQAMSSAEINSLFEDLKNLPELAEETIDKFKIVEELTNSLKDVKSVLFLGRNLGYPVALEGALKLKELAYIHAEGFAAGELKHGPIALIEEGQNVLVVVPNLEDSVLHSKVLSNISEIQARGAKVFAIANESDLEVKKVADFVFERPNSNLLFTPFLDVIPLQIFALKIAESKGLDVDKPRNLAKSVTVE